MKELFKFKIILLLEIPKTLFFLKKSVTKTLPFLFVKKFVIVTQNFPHFIDFVIVTELPVHYIGLFIFCIT